MPATVLQYVTGLKRGERVTVTIGDVSAHGIHVGSYKTTVGIQRMIELDGTGELVQVPPEYIEREREDQSA